MLLDDVKEWYLIAEEDLDMAKILNSAYRRHLEGICYHCAQSAEKYLKGFLTYHNITPPKIHNLEHLLEMCVKINNKFKILRKECKFLNAFANEIRYPTRFQVADTDPDCCIRFVEKIMNSEPIKDLIELLNQSTP
jgi:HEPN domain-containing protein